MCKDYFVFDFIHVELDRKLKYTEDVRQSTGYIIPDLNTDLNRRHKLVSHLSVGANWSSESEKNHIEVENQLKKAMWPFNRVYGDGWRKTNVQIE